MVTKGTARLCPILSAGCAGDKPRPARGGQDGSVCVVTCASVAPKCMGSLDSAPRVTRLCPRQRWPHTLLARVGGWGRVMLPHTPGMVVCVTAGGAGLCSRISLGSIWMLRAVHQHNLVLLSIPSLFLSFSPSRPVLSPFSYCPVPSCNLVFSVPRCWRVLLSTPLMAWPPGPALGLCSWPSG